MNDITDSNVGLGPESAPGLTRDLLLALASCEKNRVARLIVDWIHAHVGGVRTLVVSLAEHERSATIIATDAVADRAIGRRVDLAAQSRIYDVMRSSRHGRVVLTSDPEALRPWCETLGESYEAKSCVDIAGKLIESGFVILLTSAASTELARDALGALSALINLVASSATVKQTRLHTFITRAKHEWEQTADALQDLVCLLDRSGRVLRVNRTLERWGLGSVTDVQGKDVHRLLHSQCRRKRCPLQRLLKLSWGNVDDLQGRYFRLNDPELGKTLRVALQPMRVNGHADPGDSFAVLVVSDFTELSQAQDELRRLNERLEQRVAQRTVELQESNRDLRDQVARREAAEGELQRSRDELALLSERLMRSQESERRRIALELHDSVGQSLGAAKYSLERAIEVARNPELGSPDDALASSIAAVQRAIGETRSIAMGLRPSLLDDMGLVSALTWFCREFAQTYSDLDVIFDCSLDDAAVPSRIETPAFRIVQEALNNVAKHANARNVLVHLGETADPGRLVLEIRDDGVGFSPRELKPGTSSGLGIIGMRERAAISGGKFFLVSGEDISTQVRVEWATSEADLPRSGG